MSEDRYGSSSHAANSLPRLRSIGYAEKPVQLKHKAFVIPFGVHFRQALGAIQYSFGKAALPAPETRLTPRGNYTNASDQNVPGHASHRARAAGRVGHVR